MTMSRRDHRPVATSLAIGLQYTGMTPQQQRFNKDVLMRGIIKGHNVREFNIAVDEWASEAMQSSVWCDAMRELSPAAVWNVINEGARVCALHFFNDSMLKSQQRKDSREEQKQLLKQRRDMVQRFMSRKCDEGILKVLLFWQNATKLSRNSKQVSKLVRKDRDELKQDRINELLEAQNQNDAAHVWKLGKLIGGKPLRVAPTRSNLTRDEWHEGVTRKGDEGGYAAAQIKEWWEWAQREEQKLLHANGFQADRGEFKCSTTVTCDNVNKYTPIPLPSRVVLAPHTDSVARGVAFVPASAVYLHAINEEEAGDASLLHEAHVLNPNAHEFIPRGVIAGIPALPSRVAGQVITHSFDDSEDEMLIEEGGGMTFCIYQAPLWRPIHGRQKAK